MRESQVTQLFFLSPTISRFVAVFASLRFPFYPSKVPFRAPFLRFIHLLLRGRQWRWTRLSGGGRPGTLVPNFDGRLDRWVPRQSCRRIRIPSIQWLILFFP